MLVILDEDIQVDWDDNGWISKIYNSTTTFYTAKIDDKGEIVEYEDFQGNYFSKELMDFQWEFPLCKEVVWGKLKDDDVGPPFTMSFKFEDIALGVFSAPSKKMTIEEWDKFKDEVLNLKYTVAGHKLKYGATFHVLYKGKLHLIWDYTCRWGTNYAADIGELTFERLIFDNEIG